MGVLPFLFGGKNGEDNLGCLHPLKDARKSQSNECLSGGRAVAKRDQAPQDGSPAKHLLTVGNPVWTSAHREGYAACLPVSCYAPPPPTRSISDVSYKLVSCAGRDAPLSAVSDMKGALGFVGVFLSFLLGELCGLPPRPLIPSIPPSLTPALFRSCECLQQCRTCWEKPRELPQSLSGCLFFFFFRGGCACTGALTLQI